MTEKNKIQYTMEIDKRVLNTEEFLKELALVKV